MCFRVRSSSQKTVIRHGLLRIPISGARECDTAPSADIQPVQSTIGKNIHFVSEGRSQSAWPTMWYIDDLHLMVVYAVNGGVLSTCGNLTWRARDWASLGVCGAKSLGLLASIYPPSNLVYSPRNMLITGAKQWSYRIKTFSNPEPGLESKTIETPQYGLKG